MKAQRSKLTVLLAIGLASTLSIHSCFAQYSQDGLRGLNANAFAAAVDGSGNLYVGGDFTIVGGASQAYDSIFNAYAGPVNNGDAWAKHVAVWNPNAPGWSSLIELNTSPWQGGDGVDGRVKAIAIATDGNVYAGGQFTWAGGGLVPSHNIAYWNPGTMVWSNMGGGVYYSDQAPDNVVSVNGMCTANNSVYVVGAFLSVNGGPPGTPPSISATNIAVWNTTTLTWGNIGAPPPVGTPYTIISRDGVNFYVGGQNGFSKGILSGGQITWQANTNIVGAVNAITITASNRLFIGGAFSGTIDNPGNFHYLAEWSPSLNGFTNVYNFPIGPLVGANGGGGSSYPNSINSLAVLGDNLFVGGNFNGVPDNPVNPNYYMANIARFNLTSSLWFTMGPTTYCNSIGGAGLGYTSLGQNVFGVLALAVVPASTGQPYDIVYATGGFGLASMTEGVENVAAWHSTANLWFPLNNAPPTISIASPLNGAVIVPAAEGATANVVVTANYWDDDFVNSVSFYSGGTQIGSVNTSANLFGYGNTTPVPCTFTWPNVSPGTYSLSAAATDNDGVVTASTAISVRVDAPPVVSISSPRNGTSYTSPVNIVITASASDSDGTISKVQFYDGAILKATVTAAPFTYTIYNASVGYHQLKAKATDNDGAVKTSSYISVLVNAPS